MFSSVVEVWNRLKDLLSQCAYFEVDTIYIRAGDIEPTAISMEEVSQAVNLRSFQTSSKRGLESRLNRLATLLLSLLLWTAGINAEGPSDKVNQTREGQSFSKSFPQLNKLHISFSYMVTSKTHPTGLKEALTAICANADVPVQVFVVLPHAAEEISIPTSDNCWESIQYIPAKIPAITPKHKLFVAKSFKFLLYDLICKKLSHCPERLLYLDVDVLISGSLRLFVRNLSRLCPHTSDLCVFPEPGEKDQERFHAGVLLFNIQWQQNTQCRSGITALLVDKVILASKVHAHVDQPVIDGVERADLCKIHVMQGHLLSSSGGGVWHPTDSNLGSIDGLFAHFTAYRMKTKQLSEQGRCKHLLNMRVPCNETTNLEANS